jgi:hypothetical protein
MISPEGEASRLPLSALVLSPSLRGRGWFLSPWFCFQWWFFIPGTRSGGGSFVFFVLLLCVGANWRFLVQVCGERRVLVVSCRDVVKARSTRLGWNFSDKDLSVVVAGLLWSWWSFEEPMRFVLVLTRDQHAPRVLYPWSCACGSPFTSPVSDGDDLDSWRLSDARGFPEKERALHASAPAAVLPVLVSGGFLFVLDCIFLSLITVYCNGSCFKLGF